MASTGVDFADKPPPFDNGRIRNNRKQAYDEESPDTVSVRSGQAGGDHTQRKLKPRHIQLIGGFSQGSTRDQMTCC